MELNIDKMVDHITRVIVSPLTQ